MKVCRSVLTAVSGTTLLLAAIIVTTGSIHLASASIYEPVVYLPSIEHSVVAGVTSDLFVENGELTPFPTTAAVNGNQPPMAVKVINSTGALRAKLSIRLPPGRNDMTPDIELVYNSFRENGWIGMGWGLTFGSIRRSSRHGLDYSAANFELVEKGYISQLTERTDWGPNYFGLKREHLFSKYLFAGDTKGWVAYGKNGNRYFFGTSAASRMSTNKGTYSWHLDRIEDRNGNYVEVSYEDDDGYLYLSEVSYAGHAESGLAPSNHVKFILADRPDKILSAQTSKVVALNKRLAAIQVYAGDSLCREYRLEYEQGPNSGRSQLVEVLPVGADGISALPPITLDWHRGGGNDFDAPIQSVRNMGYPDQLDNKEVVSIADVNGDARSDIVIVRGGRLYHRISNGDGSFDQIDSNKIHQIGELIGIADMNGDGFSDIVSYTRSFSKQVPYLYVNFGRGDGGYDKPVISKLPGGLLEAPTYIESTPGGWDMPHDSQGDLKLRCKFYIADVNGDGLSDILFRYGIFLGHKISNGDGTFRAIDRYFPAGAGQPLSYVDINGDGLADLLDWRPRVGNDTYYYVSFGKGDGTYHKVIASAVSSRYDPEATQTFLGDCNGDGRPDVILENRQHCFPHFSNPDGTFREGNPFTVPLMMANHLYFTDITGNGVDDLLGFFDIFLSHRQHISVSISQQSASQDLLKSVKDSSGVSYHIDYRPSSDYANGLLPFAVNTVASVEINDGLGNISESNFSYADGLFDLENRSFAGFGFASKTRPDGSVLDSWIHQDEYLRGLTFKTDHMEPGADGPLISRTTIAWETARLTSGPSPSEFFYPEVKTKEIFDGENVFIRERYEYDHETGFVLKSETEGTGAERTTARYAYRNYGDWLWCKTEEILESETTGMLRKRTFEHESRTGNLMQMSSWLSDGMNPVTRFSYDAYGNAVSKTDPMGFSAYTFYDEINHVFPVRQVNALGHTTIYAYDERFGKITVSADQNGNETLFVYDVFGRLVEQHFPDGGRKVYEFNEQTMPIVKTIKTLENEDGGTIEQHEYYDGLGRMVQTVATGENGKIVVRRTFYDAMGRNDLTEGPFFSTSSEPGWPMASPVKFPWKQVSYDFRGRPLTVESADGTYGSVVATVEYRGFSSTTTDPDESSKSEHKDYLGRIVRVEEHTDAGDFSTHYSYNAAGDLLKVVDHCGNTATIEYDTLGRKIRMIDPDMGTWQYAYDANGNLTSRTDAKQQTVHFTYDALNRLTSKIYSTDDPAVSYEYDNGSIPNGVGRLYAVSNSIVKTTNEAYDEMGRIVRVRKLIAGSAQPFTTEFMYDLSGKQAQMSYPGGYEVSNTFYPGTNLLKKVEGSEGRVFADLTDYEPNGKIGRIEHGNGTFTIHSYDVETERIVSIMTGRFGPTERLQEKHYQYSRAGDITRIVDNAEGVVFDYSYDKLHRLIGETSDKYDPITYTYDAIGNITSKMVGSMRMVYSYDSQQPHAVDRIELNGEPHDFSYDANGNMTGGPDLSDPQNVATRYFSYNTENMPLSVELEKHGSHHLSQFQYDGSNTRARKQAGATSETFYINESTEMIDGVLTYYVFAGNLRVAKIAGGELTFYHKDHLSSSSVTTNQFGEKVTSTSYRPFGGVRNSSNGQSPTYGFTDQENDAEIGLYNYNARLYDPVIGRFVSADGIVPRLYTPQNLNRFSYCRNNPLIHMDPTGHYDDNADEGDTEGFNAICNDNSCPHDGDQEISDAEEGNVSLALDTDECLEDKCDKNSKKSGIKDASFLDQLRSASLVVSLLDCLPIGAIPGFPQIIGEALDISAAATTQGVLVSDMAYGNISTDQFVAGSVLNGVNAGLGTAGNALSGAGNVVLSIAELGVLAISHAVTSPKEK